MATSACLIAQAHAGQASAAWQPDGALSLRLHTAQAAAPEGGPSAPSSARWAALLEQASQAAANRAAEAGAQAAQALSDQARANAWMPRLDANASRQRTTLRSRGDSNSQPSSEVRLTATQPVWRAADRAASRAQNAQAVRAGWQARQARADTALQLSQAYLQAAEMGEQKRLLSAQLALLEEQLRINERRLQAGAGTVLDVLETRTRLDQARAAIQDADTRQQSLALQVSKLTGQTSPMPRGLQPGPSGPAWVPEVVPPLEEATTLALGRNPQRLDAQAGAEAAAATLAARDAERWQPTLDANASWARNRQRDPYDNQATLATRSTSVGLQLNLPLYTGGYQDGRTREAIALKSQSEALLDEVNTALLTQLRDDYQSMVQAQRAAEVQQQVEASATATFDAVRKAFVAGMRTNLDLLNAQQQIYAARQNLASARVQALTAQVSILAALDQLDGDHIAPLAQLVDDTP